MRNVLSVILVLTIASVVSADSVWFELDGGGTDVWENTTATINIVADFTVEAIDVGAIAVSNTGTPANHGVAATGALNLKLTYRVPSDPGQVMNDGNPQNIVIFQLTGGVNLDDPATPEDESIPTDPGEVLYSFDVAAGAAGTTITIDDIIGPPTVNPYGPYPLSTTFTIGGSGASTLQDIVPLNLNVVVPEPATIALLGLGSLVFYRKRNS